MTGLIIDNFAGGGGASTGIEAAMGKPIDVAINHDPAAISMHKANHPATFHYCQSVWRADPQDVVRAAGGGPVALAWFSPDCKHFSKAKGSKPVAKSIRDLAWVVVMWAQRVRPAVIMLENVEEFQTWGPLGHDDRPDPEQKGVTFVLWVKQLRKLGYKVEWRELRACDFGAPTIRKRLFLVARCDGLPITWPTPTHGPRDDPSVTSGHKLPWRTAADIIDWRVPCPSIFERARPLALNTCRRIAAGIMRYVINDPQPFIVPVTNSNWSKERAWPIDEPLRTITTAKGGEFALVTAFMAQHNTGVIGRRIAVPLSTITARGTQQAIVTSNLVVLRNNMDARSTDAPVQTITSGGLHLAEVRAFLVKYYGSESGGHNLNEPLGTVTTRDRFGLVTCHINGVDYAIADIGMRMLTPSELFLAQGFPSTYIIDRGSDGSPTPKTAQVARCGNSVSPMVAQALVSANMAWAINQRKVA